MAKRTDRQEMMRVFPELTLEEEEALREEARVRCQTDLHYLAKEVLGYNRVTDHCHVDMARDIDTPQYKFKLLLWPRGHFKSTIGTESYPIKKILNNSNERILITNAKLDNSRKFLRAISQHFNYNALFRWLWRDKWIKDYATPFHRKEFGDKLDWVIRDVQDELILLRQYTGREATITTGAVDASLVSQHYSTIIADDLINRDYVSTMDMVQKSITYFRDLLDLLDPGGEMLIIGTRWAYMDLYGWIIDEFGGMASLRVPDGYVSEAVIEKAQETSDISKDWMISVKPAIDENGEPLFPEEFTLDVLKTLEKTKGPYEFGAQYMLNPLSKENQKFHEEWFNYIDLAPSIDMLSVCITVDPAKSLKDGADSTAMVVCGYDEMNRMYLLDGVNEQLDVDELPEVLFELVRKYRHAKTFLPVGFEAVGFQEIYVRNIERKMREEGLFFMVEPIPHRSQAKEERILRLVPRIKNGFYMPKNLLKIPYGGGESYDLIQQLKWQLLQFPFAGHDDIADALADQMEIAQAKMLPVRTGKVQKAKVDFVHPSILEDRRKRKKLLIYDDAVR